MCSRVAFAVCSRCPLGAFAGHSRPRRVESHRFFGPDRQIFFLRRWFDCVCGVRYRQEVKLRGPDWPCLPFTVPPVYPAPRSPCPPFTVPPVS